MRFIYFLCLTFLFVMPPAVNAQNYTISSFSKAKKLLLNNVYTDYFQTVYCQATYLPETKQIIHYPENFNQTVMAKRSQKIEYEHIVPAENFGRFFKEWREGAPTCVDKNNKPYQGRKCAEKTNIIFALMEADMYNLYPAIGSVNAARSNYNFTELPENIPSTFGGCKFKIADKKVDPPDEVKGLIARTTLYFESAYAPRFRLSAAQNQLMQKWSAKYPVSSWECIRTARIEKLQHSENKITKNACILAHLWPKE